MMFARRCGPCGRLPKDTPIDASGVVLSERPPAKNAVRKAPKPPAKALPDFNGKWQLSASRNFDAYLTALGVNYVKRQLAAGMKPVQDWTRLADGTWQFVVQSPIGLKTEAFPIGKEVLTEVDGTPVLKTSQWDGDVLETIVQPTDPKKAEAYGEMSMRRYLVGTGADAKLILEMKIGTIVCFREFTRIPGAATLNAAAGSKAVALVNAPAAAKDLPDFRGRWQLSASRNFDAYLVALGVNYVKRQLAAAMKPVQDWTQLADGTWQFVVQSPLGAKTEAFPLGHEVVDVVDGDEMLKKSIWQGTLLYTSVVPKDPKKAEALGTMFMKRYLEGKGVGAKLVLEMTVGDVTCFREFTRCR